MTASPNSSVDLDDQDVSPVDQLAAELNAASPDERIAMLEAMSVEELRAIAITGRISHKRVRMGEEHEEAFLRILEATGLYSEAKKHLRIYGDVQYRQANPAFQELCDDARAAFFATIQAAALQRAVNGHLEPIVGGRNRDEIVAYKPVYSDTLMAMFLKRGTSDSFIDKKEIELTSRPQSFNLHELSPRARRALRNLLEIMVEDRREKEEAEKLKSGAIDVAEHIDVPRSLEPNDPVFDIGEDDGE